jgi:ferredoxin
VGHPPGARFGPGEPEQMTEPSTTGYNVTLVRPDGSECTISARGDEHLWDAAWRAGIKLPALCHQGWCLTCAALRQQDGCVDQRDSVAFCAQDREAGFVLLCTGKACSDLRLRTHQARAMRRHRSRLHLPSPYANL